MVRLLFYGYSVGIRSSRKISKGCEDRFDFVYLADNLRPSHDRISDFRKDNSSELKEIFRDIVLIGANMGLVKIGNIKVSIDGSKVKANASAKLTKDEKGLERLMARVEQEINWILKEAQKVDAQEDARYGNMRGDELPKKLREKRARLGAIKEAHELLKKQKQEVQKKIEEEKGRELTKKESAKVEDMKINTTDHDAKFMKERSGVIKPNYNVQISVDEENQFIVANDVSDECNDCHQLVPMLQQTKANVGSLKQVKADNGYHTQLEGASKMFPETEFFIDDTARRKKDLDMGKIKEKCNEIVYKNLERLLTEEGRKEYRKRMHTAEPPLGNLKHNLGYRHFLLRGLGKVKGEFNLMCIGHNLKKIASFIRRNGIGLAVAIKNASIARANWGVAMGLHC